MIAAVAISEELEPRGAASGELGLLGAVLALALEDARAGRFGAREWIASDAVKSDGAGWTFRAVCDLLELDCAWVRAQVAAGVRARRVAMKRGPRGLRAAA